MSESQAVFDYRVARLARFLSTVDGAQNSEAGWRFLREYTRQRYTRYADALVRAGWRPPEGLALPPERPPLRNTPKVDIEHRAGCDWPIGLCRCPDPPRPPRVCQIPDCGCSGLAHA